MAREGTDTELASTRFDLAGRVLRAMPGVVATALSVNPKDPVEESRWL